MGAPKFYRWNRSFWRDSKNRRLVEHGPTVFMVACYLLTSPRGNMSGIFECPLSAISKALMLHPEEVYDSIQLLTGIDFLQYEEDSEYVWIIGAADHELGRNPSLQQIIGLLNLLERLEIDELAPFVENLRSSILANPIYQEKLKLQEDISHAKQKFHAIK